MDKREDLNEVIVYPPRYGGYHRETIHHHDGCTVRGRGALCGCSPIIIMDFITPKDSDAK